MDNADQSKLEIWTEKVIAFNREMKNEGLSDAGLLSIYCFATCDIAHSTKNPLKAYDILIGFLEGVRQDEEKTTHED